MDNGTVLTNDVQYPGTAASAYLGWTPRSTPYEWFGSLVTEQADASGLLYRRNRYYDPKAGRFTQPDPIGIAGGLNSYGYAGGDPVNYSDPFGLCDTGKVWCEVWNNFLSGMSIGHGQPGTCTGPGCSTGALVGLASSVLPTARAPMVGRAAGVRYMGEGEAGTVGATGTIPAVNAAGSPRVIHYTTDVPVISAAAARAKYLLDETPTHMVQFPIRAVRDATAVQGSVARGATQAATSQPTNSAGRPIPLDP